MQISPVDQLICDCLGLATDAELSAKLRTFPEQEWVSLFERSKSLNVAQLCSQRLKQAALAEIVPPQILADMKRYNLRIAHSNTLILHGLSQVLKAFNTAGIATIPLKGAHLVENIYKQITLRMMGDVDILVQEDKLELVQQTLSGLGYTSRPYWQDAEFDLSHSLPPFSKARAADLDIHWTFENPDSPFTIDIAGIWQRAEKTRIAGVNVLALAPEDFLLHLCLHASYHHRFESGLRSLCDVSETIRVYGQKLDWPLFLSRAKLWGAERCVFITFYLASRLIGTRLPDGLREQLEPADFDLHKENWALQQIFPEPEESSSLNPNISRFWGARGIRQKTARLFGTAFPPPSMMSTQYAVPPTSKRILLYYPRHVYDLFSRHGRSLWRLIKGRFQGASGQSARNGRLGPRQLVVEIR